MNENPTTLPHLIQSARLLIGNVPTAASDEELVELVKKYSGSECKVVQRIEVDGAAPECILEFTGPPLPLGELDRIAQCIAGLYWKERALTAYHLLHSG